MADSDKNILITPNRGSSTADPKIEFTGGDNNPITITVLDDGTLSFSGSAGQLFSINDSLEGTIFSVNDISGIPSIEVDDTGEVRLAEFSGNVLVGKDTDDGNKLQIDGNVSATSFIGSLTGNAATATRWATSRTLTLNYNNNFVASTSVSGSSNFTLNVPDGAFGGGGGDSTVMGNSNGTSSSSSWSYPGSQYALNPSYNAYWIDGNGGSITLYCYSYNDNNVNLGTDEIRVSYVYLRNVSSVAWSNYMTMSAAVDTNIELPGTNQVGAYAVFTMGQNLAGISYDNNFVSMIGIFDV